jgi:hypothetical protein
LKYYRILIFCAFLVGKIAGEYVDEVCINQYLRKNHLLNEDIVQSVNGATRKCNKYILSLTDNFYKLWHYHYKNQTPQINREANIRCFIKESKKYQLHDRFLLDMLLREKQATDKKIFLRNSFLYERLRREATNKCEIQGY